MYDKKMTFRVTFPLVFTFKQMRSEAKQMSLCVILGIIPGCKGSKGTITSMLTPNLQVHLQASHKLQ